MNLKSTLCTIPLGHWGWGLGGVEGNSICCPVIVVIFMGIGGAKR